MIIHFSTYGRQHQLILTSMFGGRILDFGAVSSGGIAPPAGYAFSYVWCD